MKRNSSNWNQTEKNSKQSFNSTEYFSLIWKIVGNIDSSLTLLLWTTVVIPRRMINFFDITKDVMSYFDQFYIKTCFRQVWKIVKCKLLEVFLLVTCKSVGLNWPIERSHALLLFYLSCKLKRVGRLHDVKQLFWKPANDKNCFKRPLRYKLNQVWRALTC